MVPSNTIDRKGFTLVEIILALMIASIMAGFLTVFFDVSFQNGGAAVSNLQGSLQLHSVMEKITADYANGLVWKKKNRYRAGTSVFITAGDIYINSTDCITLTLEPPASDAGESCGWTISAVSKTLLQLLQENVTAEAYAWYDGTDYIMYTPITESVQFLNPGPGDYVEANTGLDPPDIIKVTISNENGERLTAYFPKP